MDLLRYLVQPHPYPATYTSPMVMALGSVLLLLFLVSVAIRFWRARLTNPVTRTLSRTWGSVCFWFAAAGLVLLVSRTEEVLFLSMPLLWVVWFGALIAFVILQIRFFLARHYQVLPRQHIQDPREKYLPKQKRR
ncbi:MAG: hypothetical protein G01um101425_686 [Candidatus Peregrinibacteria bacterium Gr01-1014_25]|nr:MAG: hypothetical protein G01um101425_686 [Candidatus Peregrinibacteria bacterium Gr01-1014_25]